MRRHYLTLIAICCMLQACASPKMSQELQLGKMTFEAGDYQLAFHELLPIAVDGNAEAQYAVGYMYYNGYGAPQDEVVGLFWMNKAAQQNYVPAIEALQMIHKKNSRLVRHPPRIKSNLPPISRGQAPALIQPTDMQQVFTDSSTSPKSVMVVTTPPSSAQVLAGAVKKPEHPASVAVIQRPSSQVADLQFVQQMKQVIEPIHVSLSLPAPQMQDRTQLALTTKKQSSLRKDKRLAQEKLGHKNALTKDHRFVTSMHHQRSLTQPVNVTRTKKEAPLNLNWDTILKTQTPAKPSLKAETNPHSNIVYVNDQHDVLACERGATPYVITLNQPHMSHHFTPWVRSVIV